MIVYPDVVMVFNFFIDWLLLIGTNRLCGYPAGLKRTALGGLIGAIYAGICCIPIFRFFASGVCRLVVLGIMGIVAYGVHMHSFRRYVVFVLLSTSLGGVVLLVGVGGVSSVICSCIIVALICLVGFRDGIGLQTMIPVEIEFDGRRVSFVALRDTGNTLRDPLTGEAILVVGAQIANSLLGLTSIQLSKPVDAMVSANIDGLRLISYRTVGQENGILLGKRFQEVTVGNIKRSRLVAFASEPMTDGYEGLTGGNDI